jgi:hypothetical protein
LTIDWPRSIGYYCAIAAAVAFEVISPPLGAFIALVPALKLLKRKNASRVERAVAALFEGAAKPVGGDSESTVRPTWLDDEKKEKHDENGEKKEKHHENGQKGAGRGGRSHARRRAT